MTNQAYVPVRFTTTDLSMYSDRDLADLAGQAVRAGETKLDELIEAEFTKRDAADEKRWARLERAGL